MISASSKSARFWWLLTDGYESVHKQCNVEAYSIHCQSSAIDILFLSDSLFVVAVHVLYVLRMKQAMYVHVHAETDGRAKETVCFVIWARCLYIAPTNEL